MSINPDDLSDARQLLLYRLPSILSSFLYLWETISHWSTPHVLRIRARIVEFVATLMKSHGVAFLRAVASCWAERKRPAKHTTFARDHPGEIQALFDILGRIQDYTIDSMIAAMNELIRNQLATSDKVRRCTTLFPSHEIHFVEKGELHYLVFEIPTGVFRKADEFLRCLLVDIGCDVQRVSRAIGVTGDDISHDQVRERMHHLHRLTSSFRIWSFYIKQAISLIEKRDLKDVQVRVRGLNTDSTLVLFAGYHHESSGEVYDHRRFITRTDPRASEESTSPSRATRLAITANPDRRIQRIRSSS